MSKAEWIIIIGAVLIPFIALLLTKSKFKKKEKSQPETKPYVREDKPLEQPKPTVETSVHEVEKAEKKVVSSENLSKPKMRAVFDDDDTDFKAYLDLKKKRIYNKCIM